MLPRVGLQIEQECRRPAARLVHKPQLPIGFVNCECRAGTSEEPVMGIAFGSEILFGAEFVARHGKFHQVAKTVPTLCKLPRNPVDALGVERLNLPPARVSQHPAG